MSRLDPTSLRLFISVVQEGSIAKAALREHIAAAAVSKRLGELEAILGTPLLDRTNKGVEATPAGLALLALARQVLHDLDEIQVQMQSYARGVRGLIRVFASMSAVTQFLPYDIRSFLAAHPDVQVQLEEKMSCNVTKAVAENAADIGIFTSAPHDPHLEVFPYRSDRLVVIAPQNHPLVQHDEISFAQTLDFPFVGLHSDSAINLRILATAREQNRQPNIRIHVTSFDALCLMVDAGLGIAILPQAVAARHCRTLGLRYIALSEAWADRQFRICCRPPAALPVAAQLLVRHLQGCVS